MKTIRYAIICLLILLIMPFVYAKGVGLTPAKIEIDDILRGGYAERVIKISSNSEDNLTIIRAVEESDIKEWLTFEPDLDEYIVSKNNPLEIKVIIQPPSHARNGDYKGRVRFNTGSLGDFGGATGSIIKVAVATDLFIKIVDTEVLKCKVMGASTKNIEIGDNGEVKVNLLNEGNVGFNPNIRLDIYDQDQKQLLDSIEYNDQNILPTVREDAVVLFKTDKLNLGQYWIGIDVKECEMHGGLLTFDIMERGALSTLGELVSVMSTPWVEVGDKTPIIATFKNTGEKAVDAKFKGTITRRSDNKLFEVIESEELETEVGESIELTTYFRPTETGSYLASGKVYYNNKVTKELGAIINVNPSEGKGFISKIFNKKVLFGLIIVIVIFLIIKFIITGRSNRNTGPKFDF